MLTDFIEKKLAAAAYKILKDRTYFGEIPGLKGVWASGETLEACREELKSVLEEWLLLKLSSGEQIPGLRVHTPRRSAVAQMAVAHGVR